MPEAKKHHIAYPLLIHLAFNLMPIYGVMVEHWPLFSVIYLYWLETLIISVFNMARIVSAQNLPEGETALTKWKTGFRYLLIRIGTMLFYLVFIIVFVGLIASRKDDMLPNARAVFFLDPFFNLALMTFIVGQGMDLWLFYFNNGEYQKAKPGDYASFIDARTIVLHVVIVLGALGHEWVKKQYPGNSELPLLYFICIFVLVKTLADLVVYWKKSTGLVVGN